MRAEHPPLRAEPGFTLIEVLVALAVVAIGMLGVIQAVGFSAQTSSYLREKTIAHWVAMNRLTEARLLTDPPPEGKSSDTVEMAGLRWHWTMEVQPTPLQSMRRIDISVRMADGPENSSLAAISGFYGTALAPAGRTFVDWSGASSINPSTDGGNVDGGLRPPARDDDNRPREDS